MLKELCCTAMLLTAGANLYAQEPQSIEKSQTIVYINGAKYYVHNVRHGALKSRSWKRVSSYRSSFLLKS